MHYSIVHYWVYSALLDLDNLEMVLLVTDQLGPNGPITGDQFVTCPSALLTAYKWASFLNSLLVGSITWAFW